ncbi:LysR family transcriptional regulator [Nonomuraea sp. CA-141351]|uniref:LysR family transcriptional regulator n=1 Tax=Nonomuraea sp. CA-141351 TaxID=3239996 RepID=UPI003D8EF527
MLWKYDLRVLTYVTAIAEEGSIGAAARRLRLTQPTLSRQLRELEERLGAELFVRGKRGLTPTAAGRALVERAARVFAEADAILDDVSAVARGLSGRLTVAFAGSGINGRLGMALSRLRVELPDVDLRLVELFDDVEMSGGVLDGTFDLAVHRLPVHDTKLTAKPWVREPLALFLPAAHPLARDTAPVEVSAFADVPLLLWPRDSAPRSYDEVISLCHRAGFVPKVLQQGRTVQTILALVAAGFGATVMTSSYRTLHREGVTTRPIRGTVSMLHLVHRARDTSPLLARALAILDEVVPVPS